MSGRDARRAKMTPRYKRIWMRRLAESIRREIGAFKNLHEVTSRLRPTNGVIYFEWGKK